MSAGLTGGEIVFVYRELESRGDRVYRECRERVRECRESVRECAESHGSFKESVHRATVASKRVCIEPRYR